MRECRGCGEMKPAEAFGVARCEGKTYIRSWCRPCKQARYNGTLIRPGVARDATLWAIHDIDEPTLWDIARDCSVLQQVASARLHECYRKGLVAREPAPWDPVVRVYRLTDLGRETIGVTA